VTSRHTNRTTAVSRAESEGRWAAFLPGTNIARPWLLLPSSMGHLQQLWRNGLWLTKLPAPAGVGPSQGLLAPRPEPFRTQPPVPQHL